MTGRFRLGKVQHLFYIGNAHFLVLVDQVQDADAGLVAQGFENLFAEPQIKMFEPHTYAGTKTKLALQAVNNQKISIIVIAFRL